MNIALIGAPGSGKSDVAARIKTHFDAKPIMGLAIVDDYIEAIEEEGDIALGPIADYLGNLYAALGRYARERNARKRNDVVVTCGTLIETSVYVALHVVALAHVLNDERKAEEAPRVQAMMAIMSCLYVDLFRYDSVLYLPYRGDNVELQTFDQHLQAAIQGFKLADAKVLDSEAAIEDAINSL